MLSKSWKFTIILYGITLGMIVLESFTGIVVSETQLNALLIALGIGTTAGTSNAVLSNKQQIKELLEKLKNG